MINVLSIGVSRYSSSASELSDLPFADSDASTIKEKIHQNLDTSYSLSLGDHDGAACFPTRNNILASLCSFSRNDDRPALIYIGAHGIRVNGELYICPEDFDSRIPEHSGIAISLIVKILSRQQNWSALILDCCRVPNTGGATYRQNRMEGRILVSDNITMLVSCSDGQRAYEAPSILGKKGGGIFTHFFLHSISELTWKRRICVGEVFEGAQAKTSQFVAERFEAEQTPRCIGHASVDLFWKTSDSK